MRLDKIFAGLILLLLMASCTHSINPNEILRSENEFKLTVAIGDKNYLDSMDVKKIPKGSRIINKLSDWFTNNPDGWKISIDSWATPDISLISDNFRLLIYKNGGVVVSFPEKNGKQNQYVKRVPFSEFDFLIED
jgi:hypothetical protein